MRFWQVIYRTQRLGRHGIWHGQPCLLGADEDDNKYQRLLLDGVVCEIVIPPQLGT